MMIYGKSINAKKIYHVKRYAQLIYINWNIIYNKIMIYYRCMVKYYMLIGNHFWKILRTMAGSHKQLEYHEDGWTGCVIVGIILVSLLSMYCQSLDCFGRNWTLFFGTLAFNCLPVSVSYMILNEFQLVRFFWQIFFVFPN